MELYSKTNLPIRQSSTLIIIDWDDTLFPTSWMVKHNINLQETYKLHIKYFNKLDEQLYSLLKDILLCGDVVIITNATTSWIHTSLSVLPKTKKLMEYIELVSAREKYQKYVVMDNWKKHTFMDEINKRQTQYNNIISIGDAEYEYNALVNLYKESNIKHKYLKAIRFLKTTNNNKFIEQLVLLHHNITHICKLTRHTDIIITE
jgi:hypothetical protein